MPNKQQLIIGTLALFLLVIVVTLVIKRADTVQNVSIAKPAADMRNHFVFKSDVQPASSPPPPMEPSMQMPPQLPTQLPPQMPPQMPTQMPPQEQKNNTPTTQNVDDHRAELLRGTPLSRARQSAPTTSALIMNSALTGRENQNSRQNIGETAVMDRLHHTSSNESAPW